MSPLLSSVRLALYEELDAYLRACLDEGGRESLHLALPGGETPREFLRWWAGRDFPWESLHCWWGDERCVPPSDPRSNYAMAYENLLLPRAIPEVRVHRMKGELEPTLSALAYGEEMQRCLPSRPKGEAVLDLVLLGMGPDGHIASLFPGESLQVAHPWTGVAKGPDGLTRLSLSFKAIAQARRLAILVTGPAKKTLVEAVMYSDPSVAGLPVAQLIGMRPEVRWFADF